MTKTALARIDEIVASGSASGGGRLSALAASLLLGAALLLTPGGGAWGQQSYECQTGATTPADSGTISCADQAWTGGIRHTMSNSAASLSLTVGGGAATTVTAAGGNHGINLDSGTAPTVAGTMSLTVGNAGAVAIVESSGNNNGINVRRQGNTNGGTVTVNIHDTVTIGTSTTRMRGSGIWSWTNPTATVTFTTAAAIYSTGEGIRLTRSNNTAGPATGDLILTNTGAVNATASAIRIGNSSNSTGAITVANSGNLTSANGTAIQVRTNGGGAMIVTNSGGALSAMHAMNGRGIDMQATGNGAATLHLTGGTIASGQAGAYVQSDGTGTIAVTLSGTRIESGSHGIRVRALGGGVSILTLTGGTIETSAEAGIRVESPGTGAVTIRGTAADAETQSGPTITAATHGIHVRKVGSTAGDVFIATTGGAITATQFGIYVEDSSSYGADVTIDNAAGITANRAISVSRLGDGGVSIDNRAGLVLSRNDPAILAQNAAGAASTVRVSIMGGTLQTEGAGVAAIQADNRGTGDVSVAIAAGATAISWNHAGILAQLLESYDAGNPQMTIEQEGAILGRKGVHARVDQHSVADPVVTRPAADQPVIAIVWTGSFAAGTTAQTAPDDNGRFSTADVAGVPRLAQPLAASAISGGLYDGAAGIEAQVMSWREVATQVATGDQPSAFANNAAQRAVVPTGATAADNAYVAAFRAAFGNQELAIAPSVFDDIKSGATGMGDLTDADIVTYLQTDDAAVRTLLRDLLRQGFSEAERAVLAALAMGGGAGLDDALNDAAFGPGYRSAIRNLLLPRYHAGNIRIAMNGGSIASRGDGIRAYYAIAHDNNGAIDITVAAGATVTGARAGIWVANAGLDEGAAGPSDDIRKQSVTVHGMVTGGSDAAVRLAGGGRLTVGTTGVLVAGAGRPAVLVNEPGRSVIRIAGQVRGATGADAAMDLSGGGSVTVTETGRINTNDNGANAAIMARSGTYRVAVFATGTALTKNAVNRAIERVQGGIVTATGGTVTTTPPAGGEAETGQVTYAVVETVGEYAITTGRYLPLALDDDGEPVREGNAMYGRLPDGCAAGQNFEDGRCVTPPPPPEMPMQPQPETQPVQRQPEQPPMLPMACDLANGDCRLYEALPSVLLAMNGLPSYDERMAAARSGSGGWARVETARGDWTAEDSTQTGLAYDYDRSGVRAGVDMPAGANGRIGMAVHALKGSADLTRSGGKVELAGMGVGVTGTAMAGPVYIDAQAAATWFDVEVAKASGMVLKKDASGTGYALALEAGRPMSMGAMGENGVTVTPRAGFAWSRVSLDDFTDALADRRVSVDDASSLKGRLGVTAQTRTAGGTTIAASLDAMREFQEETEAMFEGTQLKASAEPTSFRIGLGLGHNWGENNHTLQASAAYTTGGGNNSELAGGLSLSIRF